MMVLRPTRRRDDGVALADELLQAPDAHGRPPEVVDLGLVLLLLGVEQAVLDAL